MSASLQGRNSPEPELQSGAQQQSAPGSGKVGGSSSSGGADDASKQNAQPSGDAAAGDAGSAGAGLESNPKGPLEGGVADKK